MSSRHEARSLVLSDALRATSTSGFERAESAGVVNARPFYGPNTAAKVLGFVSVAEMRDLAARAVDGRKAVGAGAHAHGVHDVAKVFVDRRVAELGQRRGALVDAV